MPTIANMTVNAGEVLVYRPGREVTEGEAYEIMHALSVLFPDNEVVCLAHGELECKPVIYDPPLEQGEWAVGDEHERFAVEWTPLEACDPGHRTIHDPPCKRCQHEEG